MKKSCIYEINFNKILYEIINIVMNFYFQLVRTNRFIVKIPA